MPQLAADFIYTVPHISLQCVVFSSGVIFVIPENLAAYQEGSAYAEINDTYTY